MTCIVGAKTAKGVILGGDSAAVAGLTVQSVKRPKVFRRGRFLFGYAGSFRLGQLLEYELTLPRFPLGMAPAEAMVTRFIPAVRRCAAEGGALVSAGTQDTLGPSSFIVGFGGQLFLVDADLQATEIADAFTAIGCGEEFALGALAACESTGELKSAPEAAVMRALRAAARFSAGVREPFHIVTTAGKSP